MHDSLLRENIESLIIAVIIVLLLRFFCIEPFKIPSSSMEPTLIGDPSCGDQILVNKFVYHFRRPKRWEIIVFKYPLDRRRNFIKRLIGLPGEKLSIRNGNIYINGKIARKPPEIQNNLSYPVFSGQIQHNYNKKWYVRGESWRWGNNQVSLDTKEKAWCIYDAQITNEYQPQTDNLFLKRSKAAYVSGGQYNVDEIALSFDITRTSKQGKILAQIRQGFQKFVLEMGNDKSLLYHYHDEESSPLQKKILAFIPTTGQKHHITISNFDAQLMVKVDENTIAELDYSRPLAKVPEVTYDFNVRFGGEKGRFIFSNVHILRDIYYVGRKDMFQDKNYQWKIPDHHYFALGDNSPQSNDSRDWKIFRLILDNGLSFEGDQQNAPKKKAAHYQFYDISGQFRKIPITKTKKIINNIAAPFIAQDDLLGRGFTVFWPPPRLKVIQ